MLVPAKDAMRKTDPLRARQFRAGERGREAHAPTNTRVKERPRSARGQTGQRSKDATRARYSSIEEPLMG